MSNDQMSGGESATGEILQAVEPILQAIATSGKVEEIDRHNIRQAFAAHRRAFSGGVDERAQIIAWLHDDAGKTRDDLKRLHAARKLTIGQTVEWEALISLKAGIADAIERGDHLSTIKEPRA